MKKRYVLIALLLLGIAFSCWRIRQSSNLGVGVAPSKEERAIVHPSPTNGKRENLNPIVRVQQSTNGPDLRVPIPVQDGKDEWRTPINFYGKVVDETGTPVFGAQVDFGWTDLSAEGHSRANTQSDSAGLFSLTGRTGKNMGVKIIKESYYTSQRDNNSFNYAGDNQNFVPNPDNPIIFHLRRKGKAEPLVTCDFPGFAKITQLRRDGTPTEISLSDCAVSVPGAGQLKLEFWGDKIERTTKKFNWKLRITVPGGGMIETDEEFNFSAPENGYLPMVEIDMPTSLETWQTQIERKYFIRLNDGKYGRLDFSLLARNGVFRIGSAINPSGSRNLEFDPAAQPKQTQFE